MKRGSIKLEVGLALLTALLVISGCTGRPTSRTYRMRIDEVRIPPRVKVSKALLKDGSHLVFDSSGGWYLLRAEMIQGTTVDGLRQQAKIKDIDSVFFTIEGDTAQHTRTGRAFKDEQKRTYRDTIKGDIKAVATRYQEINFNRHYGKIDSLNRAVVGVTNANENVSIPFDSVYALKVERPDMWAKTEVVLAVAAGAALVIYVLVSGDFWDWGSD
ncbi:MAG: hypothetical protein JSU74_13440 [Candidatus Zixiibacteriota bacterium]|nr:MAG: hypothetical protein JSU74_13440 [candidate division Zixibacteria bacterium]